MSSCAPISTLFSNSFSNATNVVSFSKYFESTFTLNSISPSLASATKVFSAVNSFPLAKNGFPVSLSIQTSLTVYSFPITKFL